MNVQKMKSQAFGVEVEMNNISREDAAKVASKLFGTNRYAYTGQGYSTWSAWDAQGREWKFCYDSSIQGPCDKCCELVTPILHYEDMELLQELIRQLRHAGAKSNAARRCGVHIHIDATGHTARSLCNLVNIMASHENLIAQALKLDRVRMSRYCRMVDPNFLKNLNKEKPDTKDKLSDIWYTSQNATYDRYAHYNASRYHMLNLHATFTKGTVEFRLFQFDNPGVTADGKHYYGGLHAGQLKSYIQFCLALSERAKEVKSASSKEPQHENLKYAMRTWLLRLGFIGDEFKTARNIFTRNLDGNAAWRQNQDGVA